MPNYRRNRVEGGTYFFTLALADRSSDLLVKDVTALRASVSRTRALRPFDIDAWVVLPDHLHAVWTLPADDADFSTRWTLIKRGFRQELPLVKADPPPELPRESGGSGSGDFGNIRYVMRLISGGTSIMSISTRSSMGWLAMLGIGRFHRFGGRWRGGIIQPIGEARVS
jgi:putative transposase